MSSYHYLKDHFDTLYQLKHVAAIANWDEAVMMPHGSATARQAAISTLYALMHDILTDKKVGDWIQAAKSEALENEWASVNLKLIEKAHLKATCLPNKLVKDLSKASMVCEHQWRELRAKNDWASFLPYLETVVQLVKEKATRLSDALSLSPYDSLIDEWSPGIRQDTLRPLFNELKNSLPDLIKTISQSQEAPIPFEDIFPIEKQEQLGRDCMRLLGFDFNKGRLDVSHHPFCGGVAEDVRITTRYNETAFMEALMGICHETGHALYEFGLPQAYLSQPVGEPLGMSVHESQSLFIEMNICRSPAFLTVLLPKLIDIFGAEKAFTEENLLRHYLYVRPDCIRVDADEVTYPLHVILRYELEQAIIEGDLPLSDLPTLWDEKMKQYFNISTLGNDKDGVMQDVHWPSGTFGYFPAYTVGALFSAQLLESMIKELGAIEPLIKKEKMSTITDWLKTHVHAYGSRYNFEALVMKATGRPLGTEAFLSHINNRYLNG